MSTPTSNSTVSELLTYISDSIGDIKDAIEAKTTTGALTNQPLGAYATAISNIQTGGGGTDTSDANATANDIMYGKTAYVNGSKITGLQSKLLQVLNKTVTEITADDLAGDSWNGQASNRGGFMFQYCYQLTTVTLPALVTTIAGNRLFDECTALTTVNLGSTLKGIGGYWFHKCTSLKEITIPNSVTSIGSYAFCRCTSLGAMKDGSTRGEVTIGTGVTSIPTGCFAGCTSLTKITLPSSVTEINAKSFNGCSSLTEIEIQSTDDVNLKSSDNFTTYTESSVTDSAPVAINLVVPQGKVQYYATTATNWIAVIDSHNMKINGRSRDSYASGGGDN